VRKTAFQQSLVIELEEFFKVNETDGEAQARPARSQLKSVALRLVQFQSMAHNVFTLLASQYFGENAWLAASTQASASRSVGGTSQRVASVKVSQ